MTRNKTKKINELYELPNVLVVPEGMKDNWNEKFFKNNHPIIIELGCGKGEYTINLAKEFPNINFIGIDIKGARLWKGAKNAIAIQLKNVAFLRILIERIDEYFGEDEISEIWIPFPDPYPKPCKYRKRLVSPRFLNLYKKILKKDGIIHLKTDNGMLYEYALETLENENHLILENTDDLYNSAIQNSYNTIPTYFEQIFREQGATIKYIRFQLH
jgi:tRNA (guanine-N7-)-methyltransferase